MTDTVKIADSIKYGRYGHFTKIISFDVARLFMKAIKHARKIMDLPETLKLEVRPVRSKGGRQVTGYYQNTRRIIGIDPRNRTINEILSTIMHELVHAEQYHTGRLVNKDGVHTWNNEMGRQVSAIVSSSSYEKYCAFPWEVEAYSRQEKLATKITAMIKKENAWRKNV